jgi:deoxyribodipyrimidine photo-lyase
MRQIDISQDATAILEKEFTGLHSGGGRSSIAGGQSAADHALAQLDISGYAKNRSYLQIPISMAAHTSCKIS